MEEKKKLYAGMKTAWVGSLASGVVRGRWSLAAALEAAIEDAYALGRKHQSEDDSKQINDLLDIVVGGVHAREQATLELIMMGALTVPEKKESA